MLRNLPPVTKNLLILNILFYLAAMAMASNGLGYYASEMGAHYFNSILFKPYQIITHMFMHSLQSPLHIFFNMFLLVMFGAHLERIWGAKRYFIFYISCGLGAFVLYNSIGVWQLYQLKTEIINSNLVDIDMFNNVIREHYNQGLYYTYPDQTLTRYEELNISSLVGASGAIFGLLAGFALLFPNTKLMLLFPPIPIKAKYLIGGYLIYEVYSSIYNPGDQIAHLAHVGGAIVGIIFILVWRRRDRSNFW